MKQLLTEFILGAASENDFPKPTLPEVAFAGRSNVGKSSLLNNLVLSKGLARISSTPGKTQQINFFKVENKWIFSDLPGFGYAQAPKVEREKWFKLNMKYLSERENLRLVCLLVDSRHDPQDIDLTIMEWLESVNQRFIIILTKCDKISPALVEERKKQVEEILVSCSNSLEVLPFSSVKNIGREQLLAVIRRHCI
jgi:GTP-binding protein